MGLIGLGRFSILFAVWIFFGLGAAASPPVAHSELVLEAAKQNSRVNFVSPPEAGPQMLEQARNTREDAQRIMENILARDPAQDSFENTVLAFSGMLHRIWGETSRLELLRYLNSDSPVSQQAAQAAAELGKWSKNTLLNQKLAVRVSAFSGLGSLSSAHRSILENLVAHFRLPTKRIREWLDESEVWGLSETLAELESDYEKGIHLGKLQTFSEHELKGVPARSLEMWPVSGGVYSVDLSLWPNYISLLSHAEHEATRRRVWHAIVGSADPDNPTRVNQIAQARARYAKRVGHPSWAHWQIQGLSVSPSGLTQRLARLGRESEALFRAEQDALADLLGKEPMAWDLEYARELRMQKIGLPEPVLREYFAMDRVFAGFCNYVQAVFGVRIAEVTGAPLWQGARAFAVYDVSSGEVLGTFAWDPLYRAGKEPWYFLVDLVTASLGQGGVRELPFVYVHTSFSPPLAGEPVLLNIHEVETLFHELGHMLHSILGSRESSGFSSFERNQDLIEFPSLLLERAVREPDVLRTLAQHWQSGANLSEGQVQALSRELRFLGGHRLRQRLVLSQLDLKLHSARPPVASSVDRRLFDELYYPLPEGVSVASGFGYLVGYDALYWVYLWGEALAEGALERFRQAPGGLWDEAEGRRLRKVFLERGFSRSSAELVEAISEGKFNFCKAALAAFSAPVGP